MEITPAQQANIQTHSLESHPGFPNNPTFPLLIYRQAIRGSDDDATSHLKGLFQSNGWMGCWVNGVFDFHHYHSNTHEVLAVAAGQARLQFGGPSGRVVDVESGDVAVLPAGVAHCCLEASADFTVVGAYPQGREDYDLIRGERDREEAARERIGSVPLPEFDPVYGRSGPLLEHWLGAV